MDKNLVLRYVCRCITSIKCLDLPYLHNYDYHNNLWMWFLFHLYCTICRFLRERDLRVLLIIVLLIVLPVSVMSAAVTSLTGLWRQPLILPHCAVNLPEGLWMDTCIHMYIVLLILHHFQVWICVYVLYVYVYVYLLNGFIELWWIYLIIWIFL